MQISKHLKRAFAPGFTSALPASQSITQFKFNPRRPYFTFMDKVRDKINKPLRHIKSFMEPDGINYESQLPSTYTLHGNTAASFSAYIT